MLVGARPVHGVTAVATLRIAPMAKQTNASIAALYAEGQQRAFPEMSGLIPKDEASGIAPSEYAQAQRAQDGLIKECTDIPPFHFKVEYVPQFRHSRLFGGRCKTWNRAPDVSS